MKNFFIAILTISFMGCASQPTISNNPIANIINSNLWVNAAKRIIRGYPDYPITRQMVEDIPYASMRVKIGKGPAGLMILQKKEDDTYYWVSKDSVLLIIKNGRIIKTAGLTNDLVDYFYDNDPSFKFLIENKKNNASELRLKDIEPGNGEAYTYFKELMACPIKDLRRCNSFIKEGRNYIETTERQISLSSPEVRSLPVGVQTANMGKTTIEILDRQYEVVLFKESIWNFKIDWKQENLFWVDPDNGLVRKSIQQIAPNLPPILIEVTKIPDV
tara:strand:+ start:2843 stop:3664 length:822 start_codon:yes stop_codon:yes gene_type:complete